MGDRLPGERRMSPNDLILFQNIGLSDADTGGQTSTVGEPSLANNGQQIFMTGNWYATRSLDNGASWDFVSPFNFLPPVDGGFCCDQTVIYDPSRDLTFWLLQYIQDNNTNTLRVAVKQGATLGNNDWYWWDFRPETVNSQWTNQWFDYNHAALSNNYLYVASNVFSTTTDQWTRSVVLRLPLDALANQTALNYNYFESTSNFSLRCTLGAKEVMYFGSHNTNSQIRVFSWSEIDNRVSQQDVNISPWNEGNYNAPGPDNRNWLSSTDSRITGAWIANNTIGFIWNPNYAFAYPDACPNDRGHLGITLFRGGGNEYPSYIVGVWDDLANSWNLAVTRQGTHGPGDGKWGDYLTCRRHSPDGLTWIAAGYTLQGGSSRNEIEPRVVHFGRERDRGAVSRWQNA